MYVEIIKDKCPASAIGVATVTANNSSVQTSNVFVEDTHGLRHLRLKQKYGSDKRRMSVLFESSADEDEYVRLLVKKKKSDWRRFYKGKSVSDVANISITQMYRMLYRAYESGFSFGFTLGLDGIDPATPTSSPFKKAYLPKSAPDKYDTTALSVFSLIARLTASNIYSHKDGKRCRMTRPKSRAHKKVHKRKPRRA